MPKHDAFKGDLVIHVVLEEIFKATQIDPATIFPDDHIDNLGLNEKHVESILDQSAKALGVKFSRVILEEESPETPRELVEFLKKAA